MRKTRKNVYWYVLAFLLPVLGLSLLYAVKGVYPFGGYSNCRIDLHIQYYDFFCYLKDMLAGRAGVGYSFTKSLGGQMVSHIGYYLASPLNLIVVFFQKSQIQLFAYVVTCLKLGLCGAFFCLYADKRFQIPPLAAVGLGLAYAFTQYGVGQHNNIMWIDGMYMLPLIMLGVYRYVTAGKNRLLWLSIAGSVVFNWYTGYMNCLFAALYYLYESLNKEGWPSFWAWVKRTVGFGITGGVGVLLSGAFFVPVILGQMMSKSTERLSLSLAANERLADIPRGFLIGAPFPDANITLFCTTAALVLLFAFWFSRGHSLRKKAAAALLVGVMVASMHFKALEFIWCGFKEAISYKYRFGYIATAAVLTVAGMELEDLCRRGMKDRAVLYGGAALALVLLAAKRIGGVPTDRLWLEIGLIGAYVLFAYGLDRPERRPAVRNAIMVCMGLCCFTEVMLNANWVAGSLFSNVNAADNIAYTTAQERLIDSIRPQSPDFYRIEQTSNRGGEGYVDDMLLAPGFFSNESMAYGYSSIQSYTSCYDKTVGELIRSAGYCTTEFPSFYTSPNLPMDSLVGIKYLLTAHSYAGYEKTDIAGANGKDVYLNPYALPLGFRADEDVLDGLGETDGPFEYVNGLYSAILGEPAEVFKKVEPTSVAQSFRDVTYGFDGATGAGDGLYVAFNTQQYSCDAVCVNGKTISAYDKLSWGIYNDVFYLGDAGQVREVLLYNSLIPGSVLDARFYRADGSALAAIAEDLNENAVQIRQIKDGYVHAGYNAGAGQVLLTIPYDKGWHATVNGREVEVSPGMGVFTVVPVEAGENDIVLEYTVRGSALGAALSLMSAAAFVLWSVHEKKRGERGPFYA